LTVVLKYGPAGEDVITSLKRVSRPGCRVYVGQRDIPKVLNGLGINVLSTSSGIMTGREARQKGYGGEILCDVY
jgi:small subunit ribosomal protein S8